MQTLAPSLTFENASFLVRFEPRIAVRFLGALSPLVMKPISQLYLCVPASLTLEPIPLCLCGRFMSLGRYFRFLSQVALILYHPFPANVNTFARNIKVNGVFGLARDSKRIFI